MAITIQLPQDIETRLQQNWTDLDQHALEGFVVEAFRNGKIGSGEVRHILGLKDRWSAMDFLSAKGVYPGYDLEDFQEDMRVQERLQLRRPK